MTLDTQSLVETTGLDALEQRLAQDLAWLELPAQPWVPQKSVHDQPLLDAVIIGGGMAGLAVSVALTNIGIRAPIFDGAPEGYEGPWATTARMETLRSPKQLTGPAMGLPALTFRAWYEAQFGLQAWAELDKIPRLQWMDYLRWYRHVMRIDLRNEHQVVNITPHADYVQLDVQTPQGDIAVYARRVVLATGRAGLGGASVPDFIQGINRSRWAHSSDDTDYATLRGLRVGVVGAGASAMDSAGTALEHGAGRVDLLIRRPDLPRVNKSKGAGHAGYVQGYVDLPDQWKWRLRHYINVKQVPPPRASVLRVSRHDNAYFHFASPILSVKDNGSTLTVTTPHKEFEFDFLVLSTGFRIDWSRRPEYANIAAHLRVWSDRFEPDEGADDAELRDSPDLGPVFEFQEKTPGTMPGLSRVHCFCYPATLTHGTVSGDIPAISDGAQRLARGMASLLLNEDIDAHFDMLTAYADPEVFGDEWVPAD